MKEAFFFLWSALLLKVKWWSCSSFFKPQFRCQMIYFGNLTIKMPFFFFALANFSFYFCIPSESAPCSFLLHNLPWQRLLWFTPLCHRISFAKAFNFAVPLSAVKYCGVRGKERYLYQFGRFLHPSGWYRGVEGVELSLVMYCSAEREL